MKLCKNRIVWRSSPLLAVLLAMVFAVPAYSQGTLPFVDSLFTDHAVLQREIADPIWGWTTPFQNVTVSVNGQTVSAIAGVDGKWVASVGPFEAGGPYTITISGPQTVTLNDVMFGDVWVCSGQSNMQFGIGNGLNAPTEIAAANYPDIRIFTSQMVDATTPQLLTTGLWQSVTPQSIQSQGTWNGFSAVGYFFGRDLYAAVNVPIGLIQCSWGGTVAEAWTSKEALAANLPEFAPALASLAPVNGQVVSPTGFNQNYPTALFNGMVSPLLTYGIKGALWYQGESNAGRGLEYRTLLPTMISDWRSRWNEGNFPFLIVQLAGWQPGGSAWPEIRQAQWMTASKLPETGIVTAIDVGDATDIHPKNKQEVGRRLALVAEATVYGKKVAHSGPVYKSMVVKGSTIQISFDQVEGGLVVKGGAPLSGFEVAGADGNFVAANAKVARGSVVVSAPTVPIPVAVQYDWSSYPSGNLYNKANLPAFPFKTDEK
jgi:sialate O-acetylesterase